MCYRLAIPEEYYQAIEWRGERYETTSIILDKARYDDDERQAVLDLEEWEAWELMEAWEEEGCRFACGSRELNHWFDDFIQTIV